jgi:hypothetical protein
MRRIGRPAESKVKLHRRGVAVRMYHTPMRRYSLILARLYLEYGRTTIGPVCCLKRCASVLLAASQPTTLADEERPSYTLLNTMCRDLDHTCRICQTINGNCQGLERAWRKNSSQLDSAYQRRNCASLVFLCFSCMLQYVTAELHAIQMLCTRCGVERIDVPSLR